MILDSEPLMITESREKQEILTIPLLPNNNKETPERPSKYTDDVFKPYFNIFSNYFREGNEKQE